MYIVDVTFVSWLLWQSAEGLGLARAGYRRDSMGTSSTLVDKKLNHNRALPDLPKGPPAPAPGPGPSAHLSSVWHGHLSQPNYQPEMPA